MSAPSQKLSFKHGPSLKNRILLAPLTNTQSHEDGTLSEDELNWLALRAKGGFGMTMTCAAHVQAQGKGFPGQLGVFSDGHLDGLTRLARAIRQHDSVAIAQLHHAGMRSPTELIEGPPVCPSDHSKTGARALSNSEVYGLVDDFVAAAVRCEKAGFDGVEIHGAHGYILCQFLSPQINQRTDEFGGNAKNRARIVHQIIAGIREQCRSDFCVGVRLSPERFGLRMAEIRDLAQALMHEEVVDFLDMSLWDVFKEPEEEAYKSKPLLEWFTELDRNGVRLGVAGNIRTAANVHDALSRGVDAVLIGRAAILHHDFAALVIADPDFVPVEPPVSEEYLRGEGVSQKFIDYLRPRFGMVADA